MFWLSRKYWIKFISVLFIFDSLFISLPKLNLFILILVIYLMSIFEIEFFSYMIRLWRGTHESV